jgi:hypothetical protein
MILRLYIPQMQPPFLSALMRLRLRLKPQQQEQCRGGNRPDRIARPVVVVEPMVEVSTAQGVAFGPVEEADAESVLKAAVSNGAHPLRLGLADELPWLKRQTR